MQLKIGILNGPNLNMLGKREVSVYGTTSFDDYLIELKKLFSNVEIDYSQNNTEGFLIDKLQEWKDTKDGIVINAGAYTHTSVALADCLAYIQKPVIEVHISNIYSRETFRHQSYLSPYCKGVIVGLGLSGYKYAIEYLIDYLSV
jgi:3-dehydroquinate dehydratase-2